jgi:hypothetical protein
MSNLLKRTFSFVRVFLETENRYLAAVMDRIATGPKRGRSTLTVGMITPVQVNRAPAGCLIQPKGRANMTRNTIGRVAGHIAGSFERTSFAILATVFVTTSPITLFAQLSPLETNSVTSVSSVPTTKLLAIGSLTPKANAAVLKPILPSEVRETVQLYLAGKLDQWFVKQDQTGVVFILNVTNPKEAGELLEKLPLGRAGLMEFQLIPLGPLAPLGVLLSKSTD